jgi:hypothetical protein
MSPIWMVSPSAEALGASMAGLADGEAEFAEAVGDSPGPTGRLSPK